MNAARKQLYYLWKKGAERNSRKKLAQGYFKQDLDRFAASENKKPATQRNREIKALHNYWGCYPFQYFRFDLYRVDCSFSLEEMKKFVPLFFLDALFYPIHHKGYGILPADKLLNYVLLKAYEAAQPNMLFCFDHQTFFDSANNPLSDAGVENTLRASKAAKLFIKPRLGSGGKGIFVFQKAGADYFDDAGIKLDPTFFKTQIKEELYLVQEGVVQHEIMNRKYPHSINTFRVITECTEGRVKVLYALVRLGRGGSQVDNASSGGMYTKIDIESGALADHAFAYNRIIFEKHPDTGFVFNGAAIEAWQEVKAFAVQVAGKFRELKYLGWDIALSNTGPSVIELNGSPDMGMIQDLHGGIRDDLHIHPKDWWYQSNYTIRNM